MATSGSLGTLSVNIRANMDNINSSLNTVNTKLQAMGDKLQNIGKKLTVGVSVPMGVLAGVSIKTATQVESSLQQIDSLLGENSDAFQSWATNNATAFNMSETGAYKYGAVFGNLIKSISDDSDYITQKTVELLKASAVTASATGRTMDDVMERIRSGMLGNTEAIEDLGINVNIAMIESTDAFRKFAEDKSWNQLDFQTQSQIRLMAILEQSTKKYGNEVRENTASNVAKLTSNFQNLTKRIGEILLPLFNKLVDVATKLTNVFLNLNPKTQKVIVAVAGLAAAIGPLILTIGTAMTVWATFGAALTAIAAPIGIAVVAVASLAYAGWKLYNDWEDVRDGFKLVLLDLQGFFVSIFNKIVNLSFDMLGKVLDKVQMIGGVIGKIFPSIGKSIDDLKDKFNKAQEEMKTEQLRKELELEEKKLNIVTDAVERGRQANIKAAEKIKLQEQATADLNDILNKNIDVLNENKNGTSDLNNEVKKLAYTYEDLRQEIADNIDDLGRGVIDSLKNMYDEQLSLEEEASETSIKIVELQTEKKMYEYNKQYMERLKTLDEETRASVEAVENQINAIKEQTDKEEKQLKEQEYKQRLAEKKKQLNQAETADEREKITAEMTAMINKKEREMLLEQRAEQINSLKEEIGNIKEKSKAKEEILKTEYDAQKKALQLQADENKNFYEMQLMQAKEYHAEKIKEENLEAEARTRLIQDNQDEIISLIESYNPMWKDAGKTLGEKFLEGLAGVESSIRNKIASISGSINTTQAKASSLNNASGTLLSNIKVIPRTDRGVTVNVTGNTISGQREADKMASTIVSKLRMAGVNP